MSYYIYENRVHNKAIVHKGECNHCNKGEGKIQEDSEKYGHWLGPFKDKDTALLAAKKTGRKRVAECHWCLNGKKID